MRPAAPLRGVRQVEDRAAQARVSPEQLGQQLAIASAHVHDVRLAREVERRAPPRARPRRVSSAIAPWKTRAAAIVLEVRVAGLAARALRARCGPCARSRRDRPTPSIFAAAPEAHDRTLSGASSRRGSPGGGEGVSAARRGAHTPIEASARSSRARESASHPSSPRDVGRPRRAAGEAVGQAQLGGRREGLRRPVGADEVQEVARARRSGAAVRAHSGSIPCSFTKRPTGPVPRA